MSSTEQWQLVMLETSERLGLHLSTPDLSFVLLLTLFWQRVAAYAACTLDKTESQKSVPNGDCAGQRRETGKASQACIQVQALIC